MSSEAGGKSSSAQLDRELHNMVTSITNRTTDNLHHKSRSGHGHHGPGHEDDDEHNLTSVITLAGHNTGATFRSELHDDHHHENRRKRGGQLINGDESEEGMNTYVNSNFQAVNNSVMMGGSYTTNDPGVHLEVNDFFEPRHDGHGPHGGKPEKKGGKGKRKENNENDDHREEHM